MHNPNIIERAFQLAPASTSVDDIRKALRQEGYSTVDAHLAIGFLIAPPTVESQGFVPFFGTATRSALPPWTLGSETKLALAPLTSGAPGSLTICFIRSAASSPNAIAGASARIAAAHIRI